MVRLRLLEGLAQRIALGNGAGNDAGEKGGLYIGPFQGMIAGSQNISGEFEERIERAGIRKS